jgi:glycosyltransferase involved in cell wall biosynthesis
MPATPLISVLMPVYNAEQYLAEALESILAQTLGDFELIAIDDGSKDGSFGILKTFARRDSRLRVSSRPNEGIVKTLNEALGMSRGQFVARMDADDVSLPDRFERQVGYFKANPHCVALGSRVLMVDREGETLCEWGTLQTHEEIDDAHMNCGGPAIIHPAAMFRREAMIAIGGYTDGRAPLEDLDLFLRLAEIGRLANLPEALTKWRQHPQSTCATRFREMQHLIPLVLGDAYRRRGIQRAIPAIVPDHSRQSPADHSLKWAWWALSSGNVATSRKHAIKALRGAPLRRESWKAMLCSIRGH